jgi:hypothetical protein
MFKIRFYCCLGLLVLCISCSHQKTDPDTTIHQRTAVKKTPVIVDCNYSFEEATKGTKAPEEIVQQLKLITVQYYSTDRKVHQGQVLTNIKIAGKIETIFRFMFYEKFPIAHAIPIVKYNWNDDLSMQANNTSSFCYRDQSFSKHALGMAIDINPYFNPVRWKTGYEYRINKPLGAHFDPSVPGTFYNLHPVVEEFKRLGFHWGHDFKAKNDDHHFDI